MSAYRRISLADTIPNSEKYGAARVSEFDGNISTVTLPDA
jgi:hypothetical protein